ncbi:hypothetical protein [Opitutus sp. ER46]|uniref:SH3 domain-containing protein n=1 Tax=Opitutus sp. ER46 TaxID=2161864 RepID=UPI000D2F5BCF|nr:hypothetical protein [Opitutus sp. ER46]PTX92631.1 hypothetical protein DB354_15005 [Opitutus sp. ER46]
MKTNLLASLAFGTILATAISAAPLNQTTAVHTKPDTSSPAISYLKAGTEPTAAKDELSTPAGWMAVELPGPFEVYVENRQLTKSLNVKDGTPLRLSPKADGTVLAVAERGDKTTITGLRGRWTQLNLQKSIIGYIQVAPATAPVATSIAAMPVPASDPGALPAPAPAAAAAPSVGAPVGQPAPVAESADAASLIPRQFAGKFVSTRSVLRPRRPYDWALDDNDGRRFAYLDVSKLLQTEQIDKYADHFVVVFGGAKPTADGKSIVILVESLQLLQR